MTTQVLNKLIRIQQDRQRAGVCVSHSFSPIDWNVGAIYIGRRLVLQILQARVARFLGEASLVAEVKETANTVLTGFEAIILNEAESAKS